MADTDLKVDFDSLLNAIQTGIKAQFPALGTVEFFREDRTSIQLPACLLNVEMMEFEDDQQNGTGQIPLCVKFTADLVVSFRDDHQKREVRRLAAALAAWLHKRRWPGIYADPCRVIGCYKFDFAPEMDQYEIQQVEFTQVCYFGNTYWTPGDPPPSNVKVGFTPDIGAAHINDYVPVLP